MSSVAKFVVVDAALKGVGGHHYEYTVSVALAAKEAGFHPLIVANKKFNKRLLPEAIDAVCLFDETWELASARRSPIRDAADRRIGALRRRLRALSDTAVNVWQFGSPRRQAYWEMVKADQRDLTAALRLVQANLWRVRRWMNCVPFLRSALVGCGLLASAPFRRREAASMVRRLAEYRAGFAATMKRLLDRLQLGREDIVFFHTVGLHQVDAMEFFLRTRAPESCPSFHVVLRRDPDEFSPPEVARFQTLLARMGRAGMVGRTLFFYTDTEHLAEEYRRVYGIQMDVLPIPFRHDLMDRAAARNAAPDKPLTIAYLGDARPEKGYQHFPDAVFTLWRGYVKTGRVRFVLQSNFNLPGGEPGILPARNRLLQYPSGKVKLLMEPLAADEYYRVMQEADIICLPYAPDRYGRRSSGVLAEAIAAGKPAVVPAGTWLADQIDETRGRTYDDPSQLGAALIDAAENHAALSAAARAFVPEWRARHAVRHLVDTLAARAAEGLERREERPTVLALFDGDAFIFRTGSSSVYRSQLSHLVRSGYSVYAVFIFHDLVSVTYSEEYYEDVLEAAARDLPLCGYWTVHHPVRLRSLASRLRGIDLVYRNVFTLERSLLLARCRDVPPDVGRFVAERRPDFILANYVTSWPLVEKINTAGVPVVCETHDIQAFQNAIYGQSEIDPRDVEQEVALLKRFDAVLTISDLERDYLAEHLPPEKVHFLPVLSRAPLPALTDLAGAQGMPELMSSCGSDREDIDIDRVFATQNFSQFHRLNEQDGIDLLFVSTNHQPNIISLRWFYEEVFLPHLADHGVNLVIAGNIYWTAEHFIRHPNVFLAGRVNTLAPLYAAAKVVLCPIRSGAGTNIKTVEALVMAKPVVATSFAMRGIDFDDAEFPVYDDPRAMAGRIRALLADPALRLQCARAAYAIGRPFSDTNVYDAAFQRALAGVLGPRLRTPEPMPLPRWSGELVEWDGHLVAFNRALWRWANGEELEPGHCDDILRQLGNPDRVRAYRAMFDRYYGERDTPILQSSPYRREVVTRFAASGPTLRDLLHAVRERASSVALSSPFLAGLGYLADGTAGRCDLLVPSFAAMAGALAPGELVPVPDGAGDALARRLKREAAIHVAVCLPDDPEAAAAAADRFVADVLDGPLAASDLCVVMIGAPASVARCGESGPRVYAVPADSPFLPVLAAALVVVLPARGPLSDAARQAVPVGKPLLIGEDVASWLGVDGRGLPVFGENAACVHAIVRLLADPKERLANAAAWTGVLAPSLRYALPGNATGTRVASLRALGEGGAVPHGNLPLCEWNEALAAIANQTLAVACCATVAPTSLERRLVALSALGSHDVWTEMYEAGRIAPRCFEPTAVGIGAAVNQMPETGVIVFEPSEAAFGHIDELDGTMVPGWAWDPAQPWGHLLVEILVRDEVIATVCADTFREDVFEAGFGHGCYGFRVDIPLLGQRRHRGIIRARLKNGTELIQPRPLALANHQ